uniref:SCP domain-containing protein n=1 Tax=Sphaeramia orbicularis TaxID=375764 RepID=A0A673BUI9_9TELE
MTYESFKKEFLDTHNAYRAKHSAPPVKYNEELNAAAQKWADHMLQINTLQHSDTKDGENVFSSWSSETLNPTGKEAVDSWYSEIKDYSWSNPGFSGNTGKHWFRQVGVGVATDGNKLFVVGQYRPAATWSCKDTLVFVVPVLSSPVTHKYLPHPD